MKNGNNLKNDLIELYQRKIKDVNEMYNSFIDNNNYIIFIIENLINSYKLIQDNSSNILNILNNTKFNEKSHSKLVLEKRYKVEFSFAKDYEDFFYNEYIISTSSVSEGFEKNYFYYHNHPIINFIEINEHICASCIEKGNNIFLYNLNKSNKELFHFKAHQSYVNWIIKTNHNNLISCRNDTIKIWPIINEDFFKNNNINIKEKKNYLRMAVIGKYKNNNNKLINPIFTFKYIDEDMKNIYKMINIKENKIIAASQKNIYLFKYIIDEKNIEIELIKCYEFYESKFLFLKKIKLKLLHYIQNIIYFYIIFQTLKLFIKRM